MTCQKLIEQMLADDDAVDVRDIKTVCSEAGYSDATVHNVLAKLQATGTYVRYVTIKYRRLPKEATRG